MPGLIDEGGYLRVYINDILIGTTPPTTGITLYVLNINDYTLIS